MKNLKDLTAKFFDNLTIEYNRDENKNISKEQMSSDIVCFKNSLDQFLDSGSKEDAFVVYFCYSEIYKIFGNGYENTQKLLETLSDHEYHTGELLSKHRDHYSHSVYVFALGLAIYKNDNNFRQSFLNFYNLQNDTYADSKFLYYWGAVSLFHDIGYPFQLVYEQIKIYATEMWGEKNETNPYVSFGNLTKFLAIDEEKSNKIKEILNIDINFNNLNELLAYGLEIREGYSTNEVVPLLLNRIKYQDRFMDHGYFSAIILLKRLLALDKLKFSTEILDVCTAILLHNNFNKHDAPKKHPIKLDEHPLAYLLILCDELQCWDRLPYGKESKIDPVAWDVNVRISDNKIEIVYYFEKIAIRDTDNNYHINKSALKIQNGKFVEDIKSFIDTSLNFNIKVEEKAKTKRSKIYASDNNFINLCDFAKAIHSSYNDLCKKNPDFIEQAFSELPLEFKVSNIEQAKSYAYKLELINCFYSSKLLDYPIVESFKSINYGVSGSDNLGFLAREEHVRWVKEKLRNGWRYGVEGIDYTDKEDRNRKKLHKDIVPFECLSEEDIAKDELMINNIIPMLKRFGHNINIYSYRAGRKPDLEIAGIGHRFFADDREKLKKIIKDYLLQYSNDYRVIVRTCFAYGADQLIAECAIELGITTKAVIPTDYENYIKVVREDCIANGHSFTQEDEDRMRNLLAQTVVCKVIPDSEFFYRSATDYVINHCKKLIAVWDKKELPLYSEDNKPINRGGTYDGIVYAQQKRGLEIGSGIFIVSCHRE